MQRTKEVIEETIRIVEEEMQPYLVGAEYISKVEFTGKKFPKLFLFLANGGTIQEFSDSATITFMFVDAVVSMKAQQQMDYEIKSDMLQAASILVGKLRDQGILLNNDDITYNPNYAFGGDGLSGIVCDITFNLDKSC